MIPIGYLYKRVASRPDWLDAPQVQDIFSLSGCESEDFADYINYWRHNGYWLFDSSAVIEALAKEHSISLNGLHLFYYEAYEEEYDDEKKCWQPFAPEASFQTNVQSPRNMSLEGFDVTSFFVHTSPECSPLSCNGLAEKIPTNRHCLFNTFDEAKSAIDNGMFAGAEPGPYRIIAVYSIPAASAGPGAGVYGQRAV